MTRLTPTEIDAIRKRSIALASLDPTDCTERTYMTALFAAASDAAALLADRDATLAGAWRPIAEYAPIRDSADAIVTDGQGVGEAHFHGEENEWWWAGSHPTDAHDGQARGLTHFQALPAPPSPNRDTVDAP